MTKQSSHKKRVILSIDVGSSSIRCSAYRVNGEATSAGRDGSICPTQIFAISGCFSSRAMRCVEPNSGKIRLHGNEESNDSAIHLFDEIDNCVDETLQKVREHFPRSDFAIVAVGFSSFNMNLVGVNSEGKVIECATLSYACNLPEVADECRVLRSELGEEKLDRLHQRTGCPLHSAYALPQMIQKFKSLKGRDEDMASMKALYKWQTISSICLSRWSGSVSPFPISYSEASWTGLFNFRACMWDKEATALLPEQFAMALPDLQDLTDTDHVDCHVGELKASFLNNDDDGHRSFGRKKEGRNPYWDRWPELRGKKTHHRFHDKDDDQDSYCRFFLGIGDGACANLGSKCSTAGRIAVTIGTSSAARVCLRLAMINKKGLSDEGRPDDVELLNKDINVPKGLWCYRIDRNHVVLGGALSDGGSVVEWATKLLNLSDGDAFKKCMNDVDKLFQHDRNGRELGTRQEQLTFVPFLSGERSTGFRVSANGCMSGLTRTTTSALFIKACLEGIALRLGEIVRLIKEAGHAEEKEEKSAHKEEAVIVASGTALEKNVTWRRMIADCTQIPVVIDSEVTESTSRGAALIVATALANNADCKKRSPMLFRKEKLDIVETADPVKNSEHTYWDVAASAQNDLIGAISPLWK